MTTTSPTPKEPCPEGQHCYCRVLADGHVACCNCGHRKLKGDSKESPSPRSRKTFME